MIIHLIGSFARESAFEHRVKRGLERLRYSVTCTDYRAEWGRALDFFRKPWLKADLVLVCNGGGPVIPPGDIELCDIPTALWYAEVAPSQNAHAFDFVFLHDQRQQKQYDFPTHVASCCVVDPDLNFPIPDTEQYIDVLWLGTVTGRRKEYLEKLADLIHPIDITVASTYDPLEANEIYNSARIVLNIHMSSESNTETRIGEVTGTGAFLLTEQLSMDLGFALVECENINTMAAAIKYYLKDAKLRKFTAKANHEIAMEQHTIDKRLTQILGVINE